VIISFVISVHMKYISFRWMYLYEILYNTDKINLVLYITSFTQKYNDRPQ